MAVAAPVRDFRLASPPEDAIQSIRWCTLGPTHTHTHTQLLVAASWDTGVRVYDVATNSLRAHWKQRGPVFDATFLSPSQVVSGGLDKDVILHDVVTTKDTHVGSHTNAVKCVDHSLEHGLVLTGSWDCTVKAWDTRAPADACVCTLAVPERVYSATIARPNTLVVACAKRHVALFDIRKMTRGAGSEALLALRDSSIKHQSRCVRAFNDGSGYITATIEGRCAVTWVNDADSKNNFAFKAHRQKLPSGEERIHPIHSLAFHPVHGTFATGGGDGYIHTWDYKTKQRVATLGHYATSIAAMDFSPDGSQLAIAVSYAFEQGEQPHPADEIVIRAITDDDVKSKPKGAAATGAR